jgi:flagellar assembly protein FliH
MASPARFNFDLDLGTPRSHSAVISESAMAGLIEAARAEARAAGIAEGERSAAARAAKQLATAADRLADQAAAMAAASDDALKQALADGVKLALVSARRLAGGLIAREPVAEIEALLTECLSTLDGVPHLVVRCHPELAEAVRDMATARIQTSGFTGRLVVLGEPELALGDARIEWADGGIVRDIDAISARIDAAVATYFAARGIAPAPRETDTP